MAGLSRLGREYLDHRFIKDDLHSRKSAQNRNQAVASDLSKTLHSIGTDRRGISSYFEREKAKLQKRLGSLGAAKDRAREQKSATRRSLEHRRPLPQADDSCRTTGETHHVELLRSGFPVAARHLSPPRIRVRPCVSVPPSPLCSESEPTGDTEPQHCRSTESLLDLPRPDNDLDLLKLPVATYTHSLHRSASFPELVEVGDFWMDRERLGTRLQQQREEKAPCPLSTSSVRRLLQQDGLPVMRADHSRLAPSTAAAAAGSVSAAATATAAAGGSAAVAAMEADRRAAAPVISIEEAPLPGGVAGAGDPDAEDEDLASPFLQVPQAGSAAAAGEDADSDTASSQQKKPSNLHLSSSPAQRAAARKKKGIKRRDTPPIRDPIYKLHLSPRGSRKVISAEAIAEDGDGDGEQGKVDLLSPKSRCKVFMRQLNVEVHVEEEEEEGQAEVPPARSPCTSPRPTRNYGVRSGEVRPSTPTQDKLDFIQRALSPVRLSPGMSPGGSPLVSPGGSPGVSPLPRRRLATVSGGESSTAMLLQRRKLSRTKSESESNNNNTTVPQESLIPLDFKHVPPGCKGGGGGNRMTKCVSWDVSETGSSRLPPIDLTRQLSSS